jgi:membrane protein
MSIVPTLAIIFAIARGFGFQDYLRTELLQKFPDQQEAFTQFIALAEKVIEQTHGGLLAAFGVLLLFWSVTQLLGSMEETFNRIWSVDKVRSWKRIFSDYFILLLIAPFFFIVSSSILVFVMEYVDVWIVRLHLSAVSPLIRLIPSILFWIFFTFLYLFMPNTKVRLRSALIGALISSILYVVVQWGYFHFQSGVNRYGAIYGSFAALPLFLIWVQMSWFLLLFGAEIAAAHQNLRAHEFEPALKNTSLSFRKALCLWVMQLATHRYLQHHSTLTLDWIEQRCRIPHVLATSIIKDLMEAYLLHELKNGSFILAHSAESLKISDVLQALESKGVSDFPFFHSKELEQFEQALKAFAKLIEQSGDNQTLATLK